MTLIGGGSRSGKSTAALRLLETAGPRRGFIATALPGDEEMTRRIARHRAERDASITTWEEPRDVAGLIDAHHGDFDGIVVDCLTLWLTNLMVAGEVSLEEQTDRLLKSATRAKCKLIFVTNEVGCGIVPDNELARRFRDEAGRLNQRFAEQADEVFWMIFGITMRIK